MDGEESVNNLCAFNPTLETKDSCKLLEIEIFVRFFFLIKQLTESRIGMRDVSKNINSF